MRAVSSMRYFSHLQAGLAFHRQVREIVEPVAPAFLVSDAPYTLLPRMEVNSELTGQHIYQSESESSHPSGKTIRSIAPVRVPKEKRLITEELRLEFPEGTPLVWETGK